MKVAEIRQSLVQQYGMAQEAVNKMKKPQLTNMLEEKENNPLIDADLSAYIDTSDDMFQIDEKLDNPIKQDGAPPHYASPAWSDFALSQFTESELIDNNPTLPGLRRIAELLLGEIIFSGAISVNSYYSEDIGDVGKYDCIYEIVFAWKAGVEVWARPENDMDYTKRTFRGVGSGCISNINDMFALYPAAMAENRAESRALRRALNISQVTAEELMTDKDPERVLADMKMKNTGGIPPMAPESNIITETQKGFITEKSEQLDIDVYKFINKSYFISDVDSEKNHVDSEKNIITPNYHSINDVPKDLAATMIQELSRYQNNANGEESTDIPPQILVEAPLTEESEE